MNTVIENRPAYVAPSQLLPAWDEAATKVGMARLFDADAQTHAQSATHAPGLDVPSSQADRNAAHEWLRQLNAAGNGDVPDSDKPASDDGFGGLMSSQALVLLRYFAFFQKAFENDIKLRAALTQLNADTLKGSVDAIKRGGMATMMGNLSGATISVAMAGAGAYQQLKKVPEASALKDGTGADVPSPTPTSTPGTNAPNVDATPGATPSGTPDVDTPASSTTPAPSTPDVDVPEGGTPAQVTPEARHPLDDQRFKAQVLLQLANTTGSVATGSGNYASAIAQADRQQKDAAMQVHKESTSSTQEQANRDHSMITDMLKAIETAMQSRTSAMGVIAGNIRA
ncbi:IpaC/SipC family type III secretion system effector [Pandoraea pneumonica]|uniref:IpaC/SipC family type III secretion system effector n=1 Tax=Pandoraea pneumonica TaxID=2508299 RepID=UPI003CEAED01